MTFQPGRKKQILVLQPKGKPLYEDAQQQSSFGLKMLQSMGWKKGNGLGKNQQGDLDFIQVRYKNNINGLGFDGLKDNQWTENEESFDNLLKNLNSHSNSSNNSSDEVDQKKGPKSLEEMSKKSRARVHYKKFTKGKDVYKYSEKDLANILGKKTLKEVEKKKEEVEMPVEDDKPETYKSDLIVNTGISITDYFKQKKKDKTKEVPTEHVEMEQTDDQPELAQKPKKREKKDKTKKVKEVVEEPSDLKKKRNFEEEPVIDEPVEMEIPNKKKKKSKKSIEEVPEVVEKVTKKKKKESTDVSSNIPESSNAQSNSKTDPDRPRGANNAIYSTDTVLIPSHVAQKMSSIQIHNFSNSNLGNIVGYGMTDDIEIKVVETKMGDKINNDKYALYNMDQLTKPRVNTRKILTKIKKTKKSIQVI